MSLYKNADGVYEGDFRFKDQKRLHLLLRTKKRTEAQDRYDAVRRLFREGRIAMIEQLRSGALAVERLVAMIADGEALVPVVTAATLEEGVPLAARGTLDDVIARYEVWMAKSQTMAPRTKQLNAYQAKRFANFAFEGQRLGDRLFVAVTWPMIEAFQASLVAADTPVNSITTLMARVNALWNWAIEVETKEARQQLRPALPMYSPVDMDLVIRKTSRRERVLTSAEGERLFAATPDQLQFAVGCGLLAGLRLNETLHLRPGLDVDLADRVLAVRDQGKVWRPKTDRSIRYVPMADALHRMATRHTERYASPSWMFTRPSEQKTPMLDLTFRMQFQKCVERAGLTYGIKDPLGVSYHTLRHTFASTAVSNGVDLYTVAQLLGDSVKTVESTYAHLSKDHKRAAIAKVASAFTIPEEAE